MRTALLTVLVLVFALALTGCLRTAAQIAEDGAAGANDARSPCIEERSKVAVDQRGQLGFRPDAVMPMLVGDRAAMLTWAAGTSTWMHMHFGGVTVYDVSSRANPAYAGPQTDRRCTHHLRFEGELSLRTDDGQLAESVEGVVFRAYEAQEARGSFELPAGEVGGAYEHQVGRGRCWVKTTFRLLFSVEGTHGSIVDSVRYGACDAPSQGEPTDYAVGHWGSRWQNY